LNQAKCTTCGAGLTVKQGDKTCVCEYCQSTNIVENALALGKVEVDVTQDIKKLRENLKTFVQQNSIDEILRVSQKLLDWIPQDFVALYFFGYAKQQQNQPRFLYDFYKEAAEHTKEELAMVIDHMMHFSELRDKRRIVDFLTKYSPSSVERYIEVHETREDQENHYANVPRDVFVCFSSYNVEIAEQVVKELEADGNSCWISTRNLRPNDAENYWKNIENAIQNASIVLVIGSEDSMLSKDVHQEIDYARQYNKRIIEFKVDNAPHNTLFKHVFNGIKWVKGTLETHQNYVELLQRVYEERYHVPRPYDSQSMEIVDDQIEVFSEPGREHMEDNVLHEGTYSNVDEDQPIEGIKPKQQIDPFVLLQSSTIKEDQTANFHTSYVDEEKQNKVVNPKEQVDPFVQLQSLTSKEDLTVNLRDSRSINKSKESDPISKAKSLQFFLGTAIVLAGSFLIISGMSSWLSSSPNQLQPISPPIEDVEPEVTSSAPNNQTNPVPSDNNPIVDTPSSDVIGESSTENNTIRGRSFEPISVETLFLRSTVEVLDSVLLNNGDIATLGVEDSVFGKTLFVSFYGTERKNAFTIIPVVDISDTNSLFNKEYFRIQQLGEDKLVVSYIQSLASNSIDVAAIGFYVTNLQGVFIDHKVVTFENYNLGRTWSIEKMSELFSDNVIAGQLIGLHMELGKITILTSLMKPFIEPHSTYFLLTIDEDLTVANVTGALNVMDRMISHVITSSFEDTVSLIGLERKLTIGQSTVDRFISPVIFWLTNETSLTWFGDYASSVFYEAVTANFGERNDVGNFLYSVYRKNELFYVGVLTKFISSDISEFRQFLYFGRLDNGRVDYEINLVNLVLNHNSFRDSYDRVNLHGLYYDEKLDHLVVDVTLLGSRNTNRFEVYISPEGQVIGSIPYEGDITFPVNTYRHHSYPNGSLLSVGQNGILVRRVT
jgi:hypothetical protein